MRCIRSEIGFDFLFDLDNFSVSYRTFPWISKVDKYEWNLFSDFSTPLAITLATQKNECVAFLATSDFSECFSTTYTLPTPFSLLPKIKKNWRFNIITRSIPYFSKKNSCWNKISIPDDSFKKRPLTTCFQISNFYNQSLFRWSDFHW